PLLVRGAVNKRFPGPPFRPAPLPSCPFYPSFPNTRTLSERKMDLSWCIVCDQKIDSAITQDPELYCCEACRRKDILRSCLAEWNLSFNDITSTSLSEKSVEATWLQQHELADSTWSLKTTTDSYAISLHRRRADFIVPSKCLRCETVSPIQINNNKSNAVTLGS
ncbi:hypothetical protein BC937DRAFT_94594, partial [Endogone sp. FLAS-F59071]